MTANEIESMEMRAALVLDLENLQAKLYERLSHFVRVHQETKNANDGDVQRQVRKEIATESKGDGFIQLNTLLERAIEQIKKDGYTKYLVDLYRLAVENFKGPDFSIDRAGAEKRAFELLPLSNTFSVLDQNFMDAWKKIMITYNLITN